MDLDIKELVKESRAADAEDRRRADLFRKMTQSEAWIEYVRLIDAKLQEFSDQLLMPSGSWDGMVKSEYIKGAMSGLLIARKIASVTIGIGERLSRAQAEDDDDV